MQERHSALAPRRTLLRQAVPALLLLTLVGGFFILRDWPAGQSPAPIATTPISPGIEDAWGIRITQIGVTADGGMVDLRYQVTDPDKARALLVNRRNWPVMIAEDSQTVVGAAAQMPHKHALNPGQTYFLLYLNAGGAIRPGSAVTVVIGDLRLEHVTAL